MNQKTEHNQTFNELPLTARIHTFDSSRSAYDAAMCSEDVSRGDLLFIPSEGVLGVADTWPIAVTENPGALHYVRPGHDYHHMKEDPLDPVVIAGLDLAHSLKDHLSKTAVVRRHTTVRGDEPVTVSVRYKIQGLLDGEWMDVMRNGKVALWDTATECEAVIRNSEAWNGRKYRAVEVMGEQS